MDERPPGDRAHESKDAGERPRHSFRESVAAHERDLIRAAIERSNGNWAAAARSLGLSRSNLHRIGKRLGLR